MKARVRDYEKRFREARLEWQATLEGLAETGEKAS